MVVMGLLLTASLGTLAFIDRSQTRTGHERIRETSFNVSEALLNKEVLRLNKKWPSLAKDASPATCTTSVTGCPEPSQSINGFSGVDTAAGIVWATQVRDNLGAAATYYSKAVTDATSCASKTPCTWDSNKDGAVWVRASATVRGRTRTLVALVKQQVTRITLPRTTLTASWFKTTNNGLKTMVDEKGCLAKNKPRGELQHHRARARRRALHDDDARGRPTTRASGTAPARSPRPSPSRVSSATCSQNQTLDQMRAYRRPARARTTTPRPAARRWPGDPARWCSSRASTAATRAAAINTAATPGFIVINKGTLTLGGSTEFYGVIYAANNLTPPADAGALVNITGSAYVQGAVFVEGRRRHRSAAPASASASTRTCSAASASPPTRASSRTATASCSRASRGARGAARLRRP